MVKITLVDPDMTAIWSHVDAVMSSRGVTACEKKDGYRKWLLPDGSTLSVGWHHAQQRVLFTYQQEALRVGGQIRYTWGKFHHISMISYVDQYFARMTAWIKRHVCFAANGEKPPIQSARKGAAKKRVAKTQVAATGSYDLCSQLMHSLSNVLFLAEKLISQNPTTNVDVLVPRALTIQAAKDVLAAARKKYNR